MAMSADSLFPSIPRRIWMFWDSGLENAPDVVSLCLRSWKQLNPDWTVTLLTRGKPL